MRKKSFGKRGREKLELVSFLSFSVFHANATVEETRHRTLLPSTVFIWRGIGHVHRQTDDKEKLESTFRFSES